VGAGDHPSRIFDPASGQISATELGEPLWSPRGDRIVFVRHFDPDHLVLMNSDGSDRETITGTPNPVYPAWSPSGDSLAFVGLGPSGTSEGVYVVDLNGSGLRRVSAGREFRWSPSGARLAVVQTRAGCGDELWIVTIRTGASRRLLNCP
jgi:Tol biopolymer transport system component